MDRTGTAKPSSFRTPQRPLDDEQTVTRFQFDLEANSFRIALRERAIMH
jgi:hypothetical protein